MPARAADTTPEAQAILDARWRAMAPAEKAQVVDELTAACTTLALAGIRLQNADLSPDGVLRELAARRYGRGLADEAYGTGSESPR